MNDSPQPDTANLGWLFNRLMLGGAFFGYLIVMSLVGLQETARHRGPGIVRYGEDGERAERVSEDEYKQNKFTMYGMGLALGVAGWVWVARSARDEAVKASEAVGTPR